MVNKYPLWKNVLILGVILVGALYASPNLFPEDPAIQISPTRGSVLTDDIEDRVRISLEQAQIPIRALEREAEQLLVRFTDPEQQLEAADVVKGTLGRSFVVALNLAPATPAWLQGLQAAPMNLGLDLRGGVHFLMEVDMDAALDKALERYEDEFRGVLREERIRYAGIRKAQEEVVIRLRESGDLEQARELLRDQYRGELQLDTRETEGGVAIAVRITEEERQRIRRFALQQNITTLRKRVNELGVAEPIVQQQGENRVVVQLPGVQDTTRAKEILGATATLEFRLVNEDADPIEAQRTGRVPAGDRLYMERDGNPILLKRRVMLTGDHITDAASGIDQESGGPAVFITLDGKGSRIFSKVTGENVKRLMAVVFIETKTETELVDGELKRTTRTIEEVINVARIQEQLSKRFQITGLDSTREARDLALLLRAGALAAPMQIVEERTVGPSLGRDNIDKGFKSVVIAFIAVVVFMALYYRVFGLVANVALLLNLVLIVSVLSMLQATLTLPGIAGIVLTVGMAVDANVLIFERIREELRNGMSPQAAIQAGYERALSTIADANITTLIAAVALIIIGTGPVKGFAVTLSIGVMSSMFTAIMGTRAAINLIYGGRRVRALAI
ncbi:MAG: protein translocase subunit SecD [Thiohalocapsa sp.]|jgi:preprotein translocase subunit SecD